MEENKNLEINEFSPDDFTLVQSDKKIFDQKFETKPTTFFKDAMKRFRKNKSSVVGAIILGIIALFAIIVPVASNSDIDTINKEQRYLQPKLFEAGTGFWDGTKEITRIVYDMENEVPADYYKPAVLECTVDTEPTYINQANKYGKGGYINIINEETDGIKTALLSSESINFDQNNEYTVAIKFNDEADVLGYEQGDFRVYLDDGSNQIILRDFGKDYSDLSFDISSYLKDNSITKYSGKLCLELKQNGDSICSYLLVESIQFNCKEKASNHDDLVNLISFTDATQMVMRTKDSTPVGYWVCVGKKSLYKSMVYYCDFVYDTYAACYDAKTSTLAISDLNKLKEAGYCDYDLSLISYDFATGEYNGVDDFLASFVVLDDANCTIDYIESINNYNPITHKPTSVSVAAYRYKLMGYEKMPKFLFGTDELGQDLFKKCFYGLRQSFVIAIGIAAFCFIFGLIWGAISGYFGGYVDLFMERFCDILGRVPDLLIISLMTIHWGSGVKTFVFAMIMTSWMGTAGLTRTQFYRFKGREYVLASRTLGASDARLISKHILPNSLGTIVTSSVFMITSVIRTEASFAYLHIGLDSSNSFGVILSNNQQYINSYPYLIVFPSVIMALMMISFNLFGNGLRDALNPSLKGSE